MENEVDLFTATVVEAKLYIASATDVAEVTRCWCRVFDELASSVGLLSEIVDGTIGLSGESAATRAAEVRSEITHWERACREVWAAARARLGGDPALCRTWIELWDNLSARLERCSGQ